MGMVRAVKLIVSLGLSASLRGGFRSGERRIVFAVFVGLLAGFLPLVFLRTEPAEATVRSGFEDRLVVSTGDRPMGLAFTPNGSMLIPLKKGQVRVYKNG